MILILTEPEQIKLHLEAPKLRNTLIEFADFLRTKYKYHDKDEAYEMRAGLLEILQDNNLDLDELYEL